MTDNSTPPREFSERIASLLISCIQGMRKSMHADDDLAKKLKQLESVVRKGIRVRPTTELGKEISEFCDRQIMKDQYLDDERDMIKIMVLEVAGTIKSMLSSSSGFESNISNCVENIEAANSIQEIVKLKDVFVGEMQKAGDYSRELKEELELHRKKSVDLAKKLEQSQAQALVDPLTNALNRSAYNMKMGQLIHEFKRYGESWALLILDIDKFKKFNDDFGHQTGDKVLKSVSGTIRNSIRVSDQLFRYGGEEFVVILNHVDEKKSSLLAEKICRQVEKDYFVDAGAKLKVTISIGGAVVTKDDTELSIFERADKALYQAKNNGRNQVVMDL